MANLHSGVCFFRRFGSAHSRRHHSLLVPESLPCPLALRDRDSRITHLVVRLSPIARPGAELISCLIKELEGGPPGPLRGIMPRVSDYATSVSKLGK